MEPLMLDENVREWLVFYIDKGAGVSYLVKALRDDDLDQHPSVSEERTRAELATMRKDGLIGGSDDWVKVTEVGWAWWKTRPGVGV